MADSYRGTKLATLAITTEHDVQGIGYDLNGNIQALARFGADNGTVPTFGMWDALDYTYNGNQLVKVADNSPSTHKDLGFRDGTNTGNDYLYDANGNMATDLNKGIIKAIKYNHLNLPETIRFGSPYGPSIEYVYDATGTKLSKIINDDGSVRTEYAGNFIYNNAGGNGMELQFFSHPEGYVEPVSEGQRVKGFEIGVPGATYSSYKYVFQYKDHLGNVRLSYSDTNLDGAIQTTGIDSEIIEENNYYPFGLQHKGYNNVVNGVENNYKTFQGQELHEDLDLNWLEFKYRFYNPALARFHNVDPLAQEYAYQSPYNFSENRVIDGVELEGAERLSVHTPGWVYATEQPIRNNHPTNAQMNVATAGVVARHPIASSNVGEWERGGTNISTVSSRIAIHAAENGNMTTGPGTERNALRHAIWMGTIAANYGEGVAQRIGNAHEGIPMGAQGNAHVDFGQPAPDNIDGADSVVDFLNNEIARGIGAELGEGAPEWDVAVKALNVQLNEGLWTATEDKNGNITISRTKITQKQYNTAMKTLSTLNRYGMNSADRKALEDDEKN